MSKVLVVGGAGYVGSVTCAWLKDAGHDVWVLDDLSTGHRELLLGRGFSLGKAGDTALVTRLLGAEKFDCVMHFAARSLVSESRSKPAEYFENNVNETRRLLEAMLGSGVRNFIFSSSCAIFGDPGQEGSIHESTSKKPMSPYGENKLEVEEILKTLANDKGLRAIALRYFNAAGADPLLRTGEWHQRESHLIPRILQAVIGDNPVEIYGDDYPTPDGTCIRDYIHVWDLAQAHAAAMERLLSGVGSQGVFEAFNLGSAKGFSVKEIVQCCEEVTGKRIQIQMKERRLGDAPRLVADSKLACEVLGFGRELKGIREILSSAWQWENKRLSFKRKAIFLDRDGTLNDDPGYLNNPEQVKLLPLVGEGLSLLKKAGYLLVVISNQSGVGRGLIKAEDIPKIHERLNLLLEPWSVQIDDFNFCFHVPDENCDCRKPKPKLIFDAALACNIDVAESYFIGDRETDLGAGVAAGCKSVVLVRTGDGMKTMLKKKEGEASFVADSLLHAAQWILKQEALNF